MGVRKDVWRPLSTGPTQPGEGDTPEGDLQPLEEIDAIVEAAKVRGGGAGGGDAGGAGGRPSMESAMMMGRDEFAEEDGVMASMASAGEF